MIPQIIAHRGASYLAPENTLAAFRKAMEIGADGVEMDVQKTLDGGLVIHHDYIIDLHTDISGRIYDMTEGELKDLDFGSWKDAAYKDEKIATLAEALALCRSMEGCAVQLEMKSTMDNDPAFVSGVVDAIRAADIADRLVLISFNHDLLRQAKALMPELRVGVLLYVNDERNRIRTNLWHTAHALQWMRNRFHWTQEYRMSIDLNNIYAKYQERSDEIGKNSLNITGKFTPYWQYKTETFRMSFSPDFIWERFTYPQKTLRNRSGSIPATFPKPEEREAPTAPYPHQRARRQP